MEGGLDLLIEDGGVWLHLLIEDGGVCLHLLIEDGGVWLDIDAGIVDENVQVLVPLLDHVPGEL